MKKILILLIILVSFSVYADVADFLEGVKITSPTNEQPLVYSTTHKAWINSSSISVDSLGVYKLLDTSGNVIAILGTTYSAQADHEFQFPIELLEDNITSLANVGVTTSSAEGDTVGWNIDIDDVNLIRGRGIADSTGGVKTDSMWIEVQGGVLTGSGSRDLPSLSIGRFSDGFFAPSSGNIQVVINGGQTWRMSSSSFGHITYARLTALQPTSTNPTVQPSGADPDNGLGLAGADQLSLIAGGVEGVRVDTNAVTLNGGRFDDITDVNSDSTYTLLPDDYYLSVRYTATGTITITIPTAQNIHGRFFKIKDSGFNANVNNITITCEDAGDKIENSTSDYNLTTSGAIVGLRFDENADSWLVE